VYIIAARIRGELDERVCCDSVLSVAVELSTIHVLVSNDSASIILAYQAQELGCLEFICKFLEFIDEDECWMGGVSIQNGLLERAYDKATDNLMCLGHLYHASINENNLPFGDPVVNVELARSSVEPSGEVWLFENRNDAGFDLRPGAVIAVVVVALEKASYRNVLRSRERSDGVDESLVWRLAFDCSIVQEVEQCGKRGAWYFE
jgi:hypothetical protein